LKKLKELKLQTKRWIKDFKQSELLFLEKLETNIAHLLYINVGTPLTVEEERRLGALETFRNSILRRTEDLWRLRSRMTWIQSGDSNSKFFHKVASSNRNRNHVFDIQSESGGTLYDQKAIKEEAVNHFKQFYKGRERININEVVRVSSL